MFRCTNCQSPLKFDVSLIERYPEWQHLTSSKSSTMTRKDSKTGQNQTIAGKESHSSASTGSAVSSHASDYSQLSSPSGPNSLGNLGHSTTMIGNLFDIICNDATAIDNPMCQECTDKLLDCMDQQLNQLEEECKEYKDLMESFENTHDYVDLNALKNELIKLQSEEAGLRAELANLETEEVELDKKLMDEEKELQKVSDEEEKLWKSCRDVNRQIFDLIQEEESVTNQLRYTSEQLEKLQKTNVFNLTFHIWHNGHFGTINGFRLGRLPNEIVEWSEINAAWGQTVLLLHSLSRKICLKFQRYELVPYGNHSYVRCLDDGNVNQSGVNKELPLFCSGGYKFFWDTKFDSAMVAFLDCLQQFKEEIDKYGGGCLPYKMHKDKIEDKGNEYSVKIQFNSEERWTKAMKCLLTNLKWALVCVSSLHSFLSNMKKNLQESFYNVVALLCLLQCLYPWTFNLANVRARSGRQSYPDDDQKLFKFLFPSKHDRRESGKLWNIVDRIVQNDVTGWLKSRHVVRAHIFTESFIQPLAPQSNLSVRLLDGSDIGSNVRRNELSLEDMDLIDCLWRQDIDAEKGVYASIQPLENQFETDTQMLSEKSIPQQARLMNVPSGNNLHAYESYLKSYDDDVLASQKKFDGFDPYFWSDAHTYSDVPDEKQLYVDVDWEKTLSTSLNIPFLEPQSQHTAPSNQQYGAINQSLVPLNNTDFLMAPLNDVMLTSVATNTSDSTALEPLLSIFDEPIFDEPDVLMNGMDWTVPRLSVDQFSPNTYDSATPMVTTTDVDSIDTPSLELSMNDITRLFNDRQVAIDIANAYEHKTELPDVNALADSDYISSGRLSTAGALSPFASSFNPESYDDGDYEIMSEFFHPETIRPREKSVSVPIVQHFPDFDGPSTSYDNSPLDMSSYPNSFYDNRDSNNSPGQSSIDHDHHYCSSTDNVVEIEISSSPSNYDERKIMPIMPTSSIKKQLDDEESSEEYLLASGRDEELAAKHNLPVSATDIINMSAVRFAKLLKEPSFSSSQTDLIRKIRRRGRNKVAAQNCRQRRLGDLEQLSSEVEFLQRERELLLNRKSEMQQMKSVEQKRINNLIRKRNQRKS